MAVPLTASMPELLALGPGFTVTLDALDPSTGSQVSGPVIVDATLTGWDGRLPDLPPEPPPLLTHVDA